MILWILDSNMDVSFWVTVCFLQFMQIYNFFFFFFFLLALEQARILMHVITKSLLPYWLQSINSRLDLYQVSLSIYGCSSKTLESHDSWNHGRRKGWCTDWLVILSSSCCWGSNCALQLCALKVFPSFSIALFKFSLPFPLCYRIWFWIQLHKDAQRWISVGKEISINTFKGISCYVCLGALHCSREREREERENLTREWRTRYAP